MKLKATLQESTYEHEASIEELREMFQLQDAEEMDEDELLAAWQEMIEDDPGSYFDYIIDVEKVS